jgi:hypothetical protein
VQGPLSERKLLAKSNVTRLRNEFEGLLARPKRDLGRLTFMVVNNTSVRGPSAASRVFRKL